MSEPLRLHLGGETAKPGWKIVNIQQKPGTDFIGNAMDLSRFADGSVDQVYGSHVYEHLDYSRQLPIAFKEALRVLRPGGELLISVPDLNTLAWLLQSPHLPVEARWHVIRMIYGGQIDEHDYHKSGFIWPILGIMLRDIGFPKVERVERFGIFEDTSEMKFAGVPISLNVKATK